MQNNRSKQRIPFGSLVEMGLIKPGTEIYDQKRKINAKIMVDGSININSLQDQFIKLLQKYWVQKVVMAGLIGTICQEIY